MADRDWFEDQVERFVAVRPQYECYAGVLDDALKLAASRLAPLTLVTVRTKSVASFAEKALRKADDHDDPVEQFTDLCGARVIARTRNEVEALCRFVKARFDIDEENSVDTKERLAPTEFGYRSVHYIVSVPSDGDIGVDVPAEVLGLKAEVQVRTTTEHAWADFAHDLSYKGAFPLPARWRRELANAAAELEDVDDDFARIEAALQEYAASFGSYLSPEKMREQITLLELVREHDPKNADLAWRVAKLHAGLDEWPEAVARLEEHVDPNDPGAAAQPVLRDLGIALCKLDPPDYERGQRYLELACAPLERDPETRDPDALASLAGTWRRRGDHEKAKQLYLEAFEVDPTNAYPLGNYIDYVLDESKRLSAVNALRPAMRNALARRQRQAEVGMDLPWACYDIGKLSLLLGSPLDAADAYAKAVQSSTGEWELTGSLDALERLASLEAPPDGIEWARRLVLLGLAARFPTHPRLAALQGIDSVATDGPIRGPVVIVAGGTDDRFEERIQGYERLLRDAFAGFSGTVISGGTEQGVAGLVGGLGADLPDVHTIGYLPQTLPEGATEDTRYHERRRTDGDGYTPLEALQNWIDLRASGIRPADVAVLGINGGRIAALEYRFGLALGARVGLVEDSGREATKLLGNDQWESATSLVPLAHDPQAVVDFLQPAG